MTGNKIGLLVFSILFIVTLLIAVFGLLFAGIQPTTMQVISVVTSLQFAISYEQKLDNA